MTKTEFFDYVAQTDDPLLFTGEDHKKIARLKKRLGELHGMRVMEPGCGAGPLTEYLAKWVGEDGEVYAFDASARMVEQCRRRVGTFSHVRIEQGDVERMSFDEGAWDLIILFRVFPHLERRERILCALHQALKPTGRLVIANLEGSAELNKWHTACGGAVCQDHMPTDVDLCRMLRRCGFEVVARVDHPDEFYVEAHPD